MIFDAPNYGMRYIPDQIRITGRHAAEPRKAGSDYDQGFSEIRMLEEVVTSMKTRFRVDTGGTGNKSFPGAGKGVREQGFQGAVNEF